MLHYEYVSAGTNGYSVEGLAKEDYNGTSANWTLRTYAVCVDPPDGFVAVHDNYASTYSDYPGYSPKVTA